AFGGDPHQEADGFLGFFPAGEGVVLVGVLVEQGPGEAGDRVAVGVRGVDDQDAGVLGQFDVGGNRGGGEARLDEVAGGVVHVGVAQVVEASVHEAVVADGAGGVGDQAG